MTHVEIQKVNHIIRLFDLTNGDAKCTEHRRDAIFISFCRTNNLTLIKFKQMLEKTQKWITLNKCEILGKMGPKRRSPTIINEDFSVKKKRKQRRRDKTLSFSLLRFLLIVIHEISRTSCQNKTHCKLIMKWLCCWGFQLKNEMQEEEREIRARTFQIQFWLFREYLVNRGAEKTRYDVVYNLN